MEWFLHCAVSCVWNQFSNCTSRSPESCWFSQTQAKPYWNPWGFDESTDPDSFLLECTVQFKKLLKTHETTKNGNNGIGIRQIQFNQLKFSDGFIRCLNWNLKVQFFSFYLRFYPRAVLGMILAISAISSGLSSFQLVCEEFFTKNRGRKYQAVFKKLIRTQEKYLWLMKLDLNLWRASFREKRCFKKHMPERIGRRRTAY